MRAPGVGLLGDAARGRRGAPATSVMVPADEVCAPKGDARWSCLQSDARSRPQRGSSGPTSRQRRVRASCATAEGSCSPSDHELADGQTVMKSIREQVSDGAHPRRDPLRHQGLTSVAAERIEVGN